MSATDCTLYFDRLCLYTGTGFSGGGLVLTEIGGARSSCRALPGRMNDQTSSIINNSGRSITFFARGDCTDAVWALGPGQSVAELPAFANKTISAVIVR
ncbi:peptidase inhibitor family I36 protein [Quadrisphaera sp. DSM 44207]|uniref:peptidase inhibitor family I36 protein n=1 Tax=Quadrisphaera sp. DSM 44207 TaxID=1881057 RepID=UPI002101418D|nr:peptidase inhibitor family I36 protein [Quadrisphaera sp. DSM 44207]